MFDLSKTGYSGISRALFQRKRGAKVAFKLIFYTNGNTTVPEFSSEGAYLPLES
jgi:hypothetical protein